MLGHRLAGDGAVRALVLNDWLSDTSSWDATLPWLEGPRMRWCFADLRGYGRSLDQTGSCTLEEAADDALSLATALGWNRFAVVGHSMSALVAAHLAQRAADRRRAAGAAPAQRHRPSL